MEVGDKEEVARSEALAALQEGGERDGASVNDLQCPGRAGGAAGEGIDEVLRGGGATGEEDDAPSLGLEFESEIEQGEVGEDFDDTGESMAGKGTEELAAADAAEDDWGAGEERGIAKDEVEGIVVGVVRRGRVS